MERFHEILIGHGLNTMNVGINHIRVFLEGKKLFDYYPLRMKLFDYHNWHQLTYPFSGMVTGNGRPSLKVLSVNLPHYPNKYRNNG